MSTRFKELSSLIFVPRWLLAALTMGSVSIRPGGPAFEMMSGKGPLSGILYVGVIAFIPSVMGEVRGIKEATTANKEFVAQGSSNAAVSMFGGILGGQTTMRLVLIINERGGYTDSR